MDIVTVDLDDTLINTQNHYVNCKDEYACYMHEKFNFDKENVKELLNDIDYQLFETMGLSKDRFPESFAKTTEKLLSDKSNVELNKEREKSRNFGLEAFKTEKEYEEIGFRDNAEEMLDILKDKYDRIHLLTAGVPSVQNPKIKALNLENWFDDIHIVGPGRKKNIIEDLRDEYNAQTITHIGNSEQSDVKAAIEADSRAVYLPNNDWLGTSDTDYRKVDNVYVFESIENYLDHIRTVV